MMKGQARWSGLVMGFNNHMIAGSRACPSSTRLTHPTITNQTNPHFAEALVKPHIGRVLAVLDVRGSRGGIT